MLSRPSLEPSRSWRDTSLTTTLLRCRILQTWMPLRPIRLPVHDAAAECHGIKVPLSLGPQENLVLHAQYSRTFALSCLLSMWELLSARRVSRSRMSPSRRNPSKPMALGVFLLAGFLFLCFLSWVKFTGDRFACLITFVFVSQGWHSSKGKCRCCREAHHHPLHPRGLLRCLSHDHGNHAERGQWDQSVSQSSQMRL